MAAGELRRRDLDRTRHEGRKINLGASLRPLTALAARELVEPFHQVRQAHDLLVDAAQHLGRRRDDAVGHRLEVALKRGERRAQLVRDVLDK